VTERVKRKRATTALDTLLGEASWLLSHAQALSDYGRMEEATVELTRAAECEEQVACLLDAAKREQEAVVHRISAASCYEQLGEYVRAVTLLRAALSVLPPGDYQRQIQQHLTRCLIRANTEVRRSSPGHVGSRRS
jgi:tetratricopeptide (TPR) repeat protein